MRLSLHLNSLGHSSPASAPAGAPVDTVALRRRKKLTRGMKSMSVDYPDSRPLRDDVTTSLSAPAQGVPAPFFTGQYCYRTAVTFDQFQKSLNFIKVFHS